MRRSAGSTTTVRTEEWHYQVLRVSSAGLATLEGRLTALGVGQTQQGEPVPEQQLRNAREAEASAAGVVTLTIGMDGVLRSCSDGRVGASLPHRLLDLRLPEHPVDTGSAWDDAGLAHHLSGLVPAEIAVAARGQTHFHDLALGQEPEAVLWSQASLRIGDGTAGVALQSTARFGLERGVLLSREVTLDGRGLSGAGPGAPGLLVAELRAV